MNYNIINTTNASIAFLIVGEIRGFTQPAVWRSIQRNMLNAIGGESTTFLCAKVKTQEYADVVTVVNKFGITFADITNYSEIRDEKLKYGNMSCRKNTGKRWKNFAITTADASNCYEHMRQWELIKRRKRFDFVVRIRPDFQLCRPLPHWSRFSHNSVMYLKFENSDFLHDKLFVIPRKLATRFFRRSQRS